MSRYLVVVPTAHAFQPDNLFLPPVYGVSENRYGVGDPRWITDFEKQLCNADIPILADYRNLRLDTEENVPLNLDELISPSNAPAKNLPGNEDFEHILDVWRVSAIRQNETSFCGILI